MTPGIYLLFFLSGFSALIYEVAWMRVLGLVLGNTNQAASCVLAAFLGGLALGAIFGGRIADRIQRKHLWAYGIAEIGVGIVAPIVTWGLAVTSDILSANHALLPADGVLLTLARFLIAGGLLLLPTILMGSTLPFLVKLCASRWSRPAHFFSSLYGINTLGAVIGGLTACFFGFAFLGISGTVYMAASISVLVGIGALIASGSIEKEAIATELPAASDVSPAAAREISQTVEVSPMGEVSSATGVSPTGKVSPPIANSGVTLEALCALGFLLGFTSLSYEVLWNRLIRFHLATDTYAFTLMVSTFLMGLVIGTWIYDRWLARSNVPPQQQLSFLGIVQFAAALACATSLVLMPLGTMVRHTVGGNLHNLLGAVPGMMATHLVVTGTFILIPSILIGISFPLIGGLAASLGKDVGSAVGKVYGANTIGCVIGSIVAGLILIPAFGSYGAYQATVGLSVCAGIAALMMSSSPGKEKSLVSSISVICFALFLTTSSPYQQMIAAGNTPLVHFSEDSTSSVLVLKYPDFAQLIINGQPYANTVLNGRRYMRVLGHLPALLHPNPKDALNICFGTGTTAGSMALHPEVEHLDVVDLSKAVVDSAHYFSQFNYGVADKKKVSFHIGDGRNFLLSSDCKYDIVSFEPPPPLEAGTVNLYSEEFYNLAKGRLKPGGIMCQWIPFDQPNEPVWKMMLQSARHAFKYVYVFEPNDGQAVLIGSMTPVTLKFADLQRRISSNPEIAKSLADVGFDDGYALLSTYLFSNDKVDKLLGEDHLTVTDDRPRLEYYLPYAGSALFTTQLEKYRSNPKELLTDDLPDPAAEAKYQQALSYVRLADQTAYRDHDYLKANELTRKAVALFPNNAFFQFVLKRQHPAPTAKD